MRAQRLILLSAVSLGVSSCGDSERPYTSGPNGGADAAVLDSAAPDAGIPPATRGSLSSDTAGPDAATPGQAVIEGDGAVPSHTTLPGETAIASTEGSLSDSSHAPVRDAGPDAPCGSVSCVDASQPTEFDDAATPVTSGPAASSSEPAACTAELPDADRTVFVSPSGTDSAGCGLGTSPCKTVSHAVARAVAASRDRVVLDGGEFEEVNTLEAPAGITISGGWSRDGAVWQRVCASERTSQTVMRSQAAVAVRVREAGDVRLEALTLYTKEAGAAGESLYGVWVNGAAANLTLNDVTIIAGNAGSGLAGAAGSTQPGPQTCDGSGTGADGEPGARGETLRSEFTRDGYVAGQGTAGGDGQVGQTGTAGQASSVVCVPYDGNCNHAPAADYTLTASGGKGGCGGGAGTAGSGGEGGGSSIALYVSAGQVVMHGGRLVAGNGGDGGEGGASGAGGAGMPGTPGGLATCPTQCNQYRDATGGAGGKGGNGGAGGQGGSGAGGNSVALVYASDATVEHSDVTFDVGQFGRGLGDGPLGFAAERHEFTP